MTLKRDIAARANVILSEENDALIEENTRLKDIIRFGMRAELDNIRDPDSRFAWIVIGACVFGIVVWTMVMSP